MFYEIYDFPLFNGCDHKIVSEVLEESASRLSSYKEGDVIAMQNSVCRSLFLLCEGSVITRMTNADGKEITIESFAAPVALAPAFIYGTENYFPVSIIANSDCRLWIISKDGLFTLMQRDSKMLQNFLRVVSDRSFFLSRKLNAFALQSLTTRLLSYLKKHQSIQNLQEVAFLLGVARPSLSRTISMLVEQGVIKKDVTGYVLA